MNQLIAESDAVRRKREIDTQLSLSTKELEDLVKSSDKKHKAEMAERQGMVQRAEQRKRNSIGSVYRIKKMTHDLFELMDTSVNFSTVDLESREYGSSNWDSSVIISSSPPWSPRPRRNGRDD